MEQSFESGIMNIDPWEVNIPYSKCFKPNMDASMSAIGYGLRYFKQKEKEFEKMKHKRFFDTLVSILNADGYCDISIDMAYSRPRYTYKMTVHGDRTVTNETLDKLVSKVKKYGCRIFVIGPNEFGINVDALTNSWKSADASSLPPIEKVIFNPPATIVFWGMGEKTVVKCGENDIFDPEKGLAMCIAKKALGNQGNYYETIKKWLPEEEPAVSDAITPFTEAVNKITDSFCKAGVEIKKSLGESTESIKYEHNKTRHQSEVGAVSAVKAAKRLGVSASTVRRWYAKGKLKGMTINGHIYICLDEPAFSKDK